VAGIVVYGFGKPGDPLEECGPYATDLLFVRVTAP
jgi:hypothetical protein